MKKRPLLGFCLWLAFNGCAILMRLLSEAQGLSIDSTIQLMAAIVLPVIAGLFAARHFRVRVCVGLVVMSITSLLFSLGVFSGLLLVNLAVAYGLAGDMLAGSFMKDD